MKIFTAKQLAKADQITVKKQAISSLELMERAASGAFEKILKRLENFEGIVNVFCGIGNNGGDGLVIARKLAERGFRLRVFIVDYSPKHSPDFEVHLKRLKQVYEENVIFINKNKVKLQLYNNEIIIDAIFGIGLNRPLLDWVDDLLGYINNTQCFVIAIDIPTGMIPDHSPEKEQNILKADLTLTFQSPKFAFFLSQWVDYVGEMKLIDIGLDKDYIAETDTEAVLIQEEKILTLRKPRKRFSHKGTYGHCLIIGGSYGKIGSIALSSKAGLRVGAGKLTTLIPSCGYEILQTSFPEAMVLTTDDKILTQFTELPFTPEVICFGMGAGTAKETATFFEDLLKVTHKPMLIDADGLNLLAKDNDLLKLIPENSVLTPHPKELERLIGSWNNDFDKLEKTKTFVQRHKVIVVVKDAISMTVTRKNIFVNSTGNPGMATAGSGDVLSGMIAGLMAQGYSSENAAIFGVYLHGKAGDLSLKKLSEEALIARDIIKNIGKAFLSLDGKSLELKRDFAKE